ncbi:MAG TPA: flavin reductase family protein [Acidobacteriota bacterium]|nr:flavin reductase family protein [Acidobacteriota bacterium]
MPTAQEFRRVMSYFVTGITVVTAVTPEGQIYGITVNSFTSVSLEPLLVLICLDNRLNGFSAFQVGGAFGVSILAEDQEDVSRYFARRGVERPEGVYFEGITGVPLIAGSLATLECEVVEVFPGGDHTIFLGAVKACDLRPEAETKGALVYFRSRYHRLAAQK